MGLDDSIEEPVLSTASTNNSQNDLCEPKLYKKRWLILALFWIYSAANFMQFMLYSVVADLVVQYYGVSYTTAEWSTMICMLVYVICMIPGSYILDTLGLRWSVIIGITGTLIGSWIKVLSVNPEKYWVLLVGQGFMSIFQVFVTPLPPKIAAVWFGGHEVSTACSIALLGPQIGIIVGFLLAPLLIRPGTNEDIEKGLEMLAYFVAIYSSVVLPIVVIFFYDSPPTPPSFAQLNVVKHKGKSDFFSSLKRLLSNRSYMFFLMSVGVLFGAMGPVSINLNQLMTLHFHEDGAAHIGYILTTAATTTLVGCFAVGFILDKFPYFKIITILLTLLTSLSLVAFIGTLHLNIYWMYGGAAFLGLMSAALFTIAFELGVELTYPEPEGTTGALFNAVNQLFGVAFTYMHSYLLSNINEFWSNVAIYCLIIVGNLFMCGVTFDLKRKKAEKENKTNTVVATDVAL